MYTRTINAINTVKTLFLVSIWSE